MNALPPAIATITLFVEDLDTTRCFYRDVFDPQVVFEDDVSTVLKFGEMQINLLKISEATDLIGPAKVAERDAGVRMQFTVQVDDVDAMCDELVSRGVEMINGPIDRPWGVRTACFSDPAGHNWEIAQPIQ